MTTTNTDLKTDALRKPRDDEVDFVGLTHTGKVRATNQDHFLICSLRKGVEVHATSLEDLTPLTKAGERMAFLAMVADGVGSGAKGGAACPLSKCLDARGCVPARPACTIPPLRQRGSPLCTA